jgi:hypothetical protein
MTALAQHVLYGVTKLVPITEAELGKFLAAALIKNQNKEPEFILNPDFCCETIAWLNSQLETHGYELTALKTFAESCFSLVQDQCGNIAGSEQIDSRFVTAFIFRK